MKLGQRLMVSVALMFSNWSESIRVEVNHAGCCKLYTQSDLCGVARVSLYSGHDLANPDSLSESIDDCFVSSAVGARQMTQAILYEQSLRHLLAPIYAALEDPSVSEIMINGYNDIYIEQGGQLLRMDARFDSEDALESAMRNVAQFVGKRLEPGTPSIEARLPDGSRVHIVQAPAARNGLCVAIRKFSRNKLDLDALVESGTLNGEAAEFLGICVGMAKNIIVSGGTGSGKTTLLNVLSTMIPEDERIIVLEDSSELQLQQPHVVSFEVQAPDRQGLGGIDIAGLFRASLRMRPDRIIVGECRGGEALDMIQAMTSGHSGSLSTCHANTPSGALNRLETMALMAGVDIPLFALRAQLASAIDVIVQISRFHDGRRRVIAISEVLDLNEKGEYLVEDLYRYEHAARKAADTLIWSGKPASFRQQLSYSAMAETIRLSGRVWGGGK